MPEIKQRHLEKLLIESVRYCLGRMTYTVSECSQIVRIHWKDIGSGAKSVIKKDIQGLIQQHTDFIHNEKYQQQISVEGYSPIGMECDAFTWIELLNWIDEQEKENEQRK